MELRGKGRGGVGSLVGLGFAVIQMGATLMEKLCQILSWGKGQPLQKPGKGCKEGQDNLASCRKKAGTG